MSDKTQSPLLGVVIPTFKQPGFLVEAIGSLLLQSFKNWVAVVVVDGCPFAETTSYLNAITKEDKRIVFTEINNVGLAAARNVGINFLLTHFEKIEGIYFLDSDNRLLGSFFDRCVELLRTVSKSKVVFYPKIQTFGVNKFNDSDKEYFENQLQPSTFTFASLNLVEAGSLVRTSVFRQGFRFDESMKSGFEDWEFWRRLASHGYKFYPIGNFGFRYRVRPESMLADSSTQKNILSIARESLESKYRNHSNVAQVGEKTWEEFPGILIESEALRLENEFQDALFGVRRLTIEDFLNNFFQPQICGEPAVNFSFVAIANRGSLPFEIPKQFLANIIWHISMIALSSGVATLRITENFQSQHDFVIRKGSSSSGGVQLVIISSKVLYEVLRSGEFSWLREHISDLVCSEKLNYEVLIKSGLVRGQSDFENPNTKPKFSVNKVADFQNDRKNFFQSRIVHDDPFNAILSKFLKKLEDFHAKNFDATFTKLLDKGLEYDRHLRRSNSERQGQDWVMPLPIPYSAKKSIAILLSAMEFGGVERSATEISSSFEDKAEIFYLIASTEATLLKKMSNVLSVFTTASVINGKILGSLNYEWTESNDWFGHSFPGKYEFATNLYGIICRFGVVIVEQEATVLSLLQLLKKYAVMIIVHIHVLDKTAFGNQVGHPYLAVMNEHKIDLFIASAIFWQEWLIANSVPSSKVIVLRNVPYQVSAAPISKQLPARKIESLKVLFVGRSSTQKAIDRFLMIAIESARQDLPIEFRCVTDLNKLIAIELAAIGNVELVQNNYEIQDHLEWADVLLNTSQYEGLPLVFLEALALGKYVCSPKFSSVNRETTLDSQLLISYNNEDSTWGVLSTLTNVSKRLVEDLSEFKANQFDHLKQVDQLLERVFQI